MAQRLWIEKIAAGAARCREPVTEIGKKGGEYIAAHALYVSQPQRPGDPLWNRANCRNRTSFNDRVGQGAATYIEPCLIRLYRRDMGGGQFVLMKDVSAPIYVNGRHWGALRLLVKI